MRRLAATCGALLLGAGLLITPAIGQEAVSADNIVKALKKKGKTRSILQPSGSGLTDEQSNFIDGLKGKTREIVVEERKQLTKIVKDQGLPSFDLEIYFNLNSAEITGEARPALRELGLALRNVQLKDAVILLNGHTDATGSAEHNQQLSQARAKSVRTFLIDNFGVSANQLIAVGYGEEQLKNSAEPDAGENRRVQIVNLGG